MRLFADPPPVPAGPSLGSTLAEFPGPMPLYRARRAAGKLKGDPAQELATEKLQILHRGLLQYRPTPSVNPTGWRARLGLGGPQEAREPRPRGIYIYGGVGRGKSMLMDLFFESSAVPRKRRVHFHAFMQEVHARLHRLRTSVRGEPLAAVAAEIADEAWLLCFDEFQVTDIADAMILGRLFEALFTQGIVVIATSNRAPDDLYRDGLQRERFLPFIGMLKTELDVLHLDNGRDYRLSRLAGQQVYYAPLDDTAVRALKAIFSDLTDDMRPEPMELEIHKRKLVVPRQACGAAWFEFQELCGRPLGAADYLAIAERFEAVIIANIPFLGPDQRNEAKRFNTLIDALYEAKTHVVISAAAPPDALYPAGDGSFEFERTVSRLMEMQSIEYLSSRPAAARTNAPCSNNTAAQPERGPMLAG